MIVANVSIEDIRKSTGKAYQAIAVIMEKYCKNPSLMFWTTLDAELKATAKTAKGADDYFPSALWLKMGDIVLRWHMNGCGEVADHEIKPMLQEVWKYHRSHIGQPQTDEAWDAIYSEGEKLCDGKKDIEKQFIIAAMRDLERRNPKAESAKN